jgi:ribosomal protein L37AE/L43A
MFRPDRPVPITMKVAEIDPRDRLSLQCPQCRRQIGRQGYDLGLDLPPDLLVIRYVARHYCTACSRPGHRVRPQGWISPYPRSGAESNLAPAHVRDSP